MHTIEIEKRERRESSWASQLTITDGRQDEDYEFKTIRIGRAVSPEHLGDVRLYLDGDVSCASINYAFWDGFVDTHSKNVRPNPYL